MLDFLESFIGGKWLSPFSTKHWFWIGMRFGREPAQTTHTHWGHCLAGLLLNRCDGTRVISMWGRFWRGLPSSLPFPEYRGRLHQFRGILWAFVMKNWLNEDEIERSKAKQMDFRQKRRAQKRIGMQGSVGKAYPFLGALGRNDELFEEKNLGDWNDTEK